MDDLLALCRREYPAACLYKSIDGPILEVEGVIASTQMQGQHYVVTVRNNIGDITIVVRKGAYPVYCKKYLEFRMPYCSVEITGVMRASDSVPGGVEMVITRLQNRHVIHHNLRSLTTGWWLVGKPLPELDETILEYVQKYPKIKQADIIRKIRYENPTTIRKHLHELVQSKKIKEESNGYTLINYSFGNKVAALYCEGGLMSDALERTIPRDQPDHPKPETTNPPEILRLCIDKNIGYFKELQTMLPEYDFDSKWTILRHIANYPERLDEFIEEEINHWSSLQYSIEDKCATVCDDILYQLRNSDNREDIEGILCYTVERILEYTLFVDREAQKLKYDSLAKNKQKNKTLKDLEREREDGFQDLCNIQNNLKCRLALSEFEKSLERLQKKYQKLHSPPDSSRSKKTPKLRAAKQCPDLESKITELIIQYPGIRQYIIMDKFKHKCPKSTIERRLKNLQVQCKIMRLPGYEARYVAKECRYTQDLERLLIFHIGRIVCYLEEVKMKIRGCPDEAKLSILEHMASEHYKKIEEHVETQTTKLKRAFREIDDYANETHRLLKNSKRVVKKQEWARIIDKIRLNQRKHKRDAMKLEEAVYDRKNIEKMEQMSLRHQVGHLAYSDAETDMRVIKLALKYEFDLTVLEKTRDEMQNRYAVRNTTEVEDVIITMLDIEPQIFSIHQDLLDTITQIKIHMDAGRTYRPHTITESDGQPEFVLPHIDSCIQARKLYSECSSMWDTIKNWRDTRTYDDVIAPLVGKAANLDSYLGIDFNPYEE